MKRIFSLFLALLLALSLISCSQENAELLLDIAIGVLDEGGIPSETPSGSSTGTAQQSPDTPKNPISEDGIYTGKEEVALYIHTYGRLPDNFITKKDAQKLGWPGGKLEFYAPGKCIGGDRFGNYEGRLPSKDGRTYQECDIDTLGADSRGAKRIVFSNDGLIYYSGDHYETFELLYGEEPNKWN